MVFGGPSGWLAEDINNDSTEDNGTLTTDYEGPRSVVIWDRSSSGSSSTATVRIATWVTNDRAITALGYVRQHRPLGDGGNGARRRC